MAHRPSSHRRSGTKRPKRQAAQRPELPRQKKHLGQHFLVSQDPINTMLATVPITPETTVVEIGCGNGILTRALLETKCKALHVIEIDPDWADHIADTIKSPRLHIHLKDALHFDFSALKKEGERLVLLANLPYLITFPLFEKLSHTNTLFDDGMVMVQEEAAERLAHNSGRRYGAVSVYLQYYFEFTMHEKVPPHLFNPAPNVMSRLVRFKPRTAPITIPDPDDFWAFVWDCFASPRQNLGNNLRRSAHAWQKLPEETLRLRAQQLDVVQLYELWKTVKE